MKVITKSKFKILKQLQKLYPTHNANFLLSLDKLIKKQRNPVIVRYVLQMGKVRKNNRIFLRVFQLKIIGQKCVDKKRKANCKKKKILAWKLLMTKQTKKVTKEKDLFCQLKMTENNNIKEIVKASVGDNLILNGHQNRINVENGDKIDTNRIDFLRNKFIQNSILEKDVHMNVQQLQKSPETSSHSTNKSFVDKLLNKLNSQGSLKTSDMIKDNCKLSKVELNKKLDHLANAKSDLLRDVDECSSSSSNIHEFYGFSDTEINVYQNMQNILHLPNYHQEEVSNLKSVFESEKLNDFLKENSLENCSNIAIPTTKFNYEEGLVSSESNIPKMDCPTLLVSKKARTVAEKRQLLQNKNDIQFLMVENESTIYWELQKRLKSDAYFNYQIIADIQQQNLPIRRDIWKTAAWLSTQPGKFYFQSLKLKDSSVKLRGGLGNFETQLIQIKRVNFKKQLCTAGCANLKILGHIKVHLNDLVNLTQQTKTVEKLHSRSKLIDNYTTSFKKFKPGPLSSKLLADDMGRLQIYQMPSVQLEIFPRLKYEFDKNIKSYLKLIQPTDSITIEWAKFSCSTLIEPKKSLNENVLNSRTTSYIFDIPYLDNKSKILTRKLFNKNQKENKKSDIDIESLEKPLEFSKHIDKNNALECEIGEYLTDVINSVGISMCQDQMIADDPDLDYDKKEGVQSSIKGRIMKTVDDKIIRQNKSKLLKELRRLNATFIETNDSRNSKCTEEHCSLGCVCLDIRNITTSHCRKEKCMFQCNCKREETYIKRSALVENGLSDEHVRMLRDKATERLAKIEKEFSSTIVLTNDDTILIHNTQVESKRNRKPPKNFNQFLSKREENAHVLETQANSSINYMAHCNVELEEMEILGELEVYCMVHGLYKCFCKGKATKGDKFTLAEPTIKPFQEYISPPAKKRNYIFLKDTSPPVEDVESYTSSARTRAVNKILHIAKNKRNRDSVLARINREAHFLPKLKKIVEKCLYTKTVMIANNICFIPRHEIDNMNITIAHNTFEQSNTNNNIKADQLSFTDFKGPIQNSKSSPVSINFNENEYKNKEKYHNELRTKNKETEVSTLPNSNTNCRIPVDKIIAFSQDIDHKLSLIKTKNSDQRNDHISKLNLTVTKAMSRICAMQRNNMEVIPKPQKNCVNNINWNHLIRIYDEEKIFLWQARCYNEVYSKRYIVLALTITNASPTIPNAFSVTNIRAIAPNQLTTIGSMIHLKVKNANTNKLAVLIVGDETYWSVIGCIHSDINYIDDGVIVRPTPATHPLLAKKINSLNYMLINKTNSINKIATTTTMNKIETKESKSIEKSQINNREKESINKIPQPTNQKLHKTNIEIAELNLNDNKSIFLPIPVVGDHRWFMLDVVDDFSDIYIPGWKSFLKYERIIQTHKLAKLRSKTVRLLHRNSQSFYPHVFVTPNQVNKIIFGPYPMHEQIDLILCQELDGKILTREVYEKQTNITKTTRTKGCWLSVKNNRYLTIDDSCIVIDDDCNIGSKVVTNNTQSVSKFMIVDNKIISNENSDISNDELKDTTKPTESMLVNSPLPSSSVFADVGLKPDIVINTASIVDGKIVEIEVKKPVNVNSNKVNPTPKKKGYSILKPLSSTITGNPIPSEHQSKIANAKDIMPNVISSELKSAVQSGSFIKIDPIKYNVQDSVKTLNKDSNSCSNATAKNESRPNDVPLLKQNDSSQSTNTGDRCAITTEDQIAYTKGTICINNPITTNLKHNPSNPNSLMNTILSKKYTCTNDPIKIILEQRNSYQPTLKKDNTLQKSETKRNLSHISPENTDLSSVTLLKKPIVLNKSPPEEKIQSTSSDTSMSLVSCTITKDPDSTTSPQSIEKIKDRRQTINQTTDCLGSNSKKRRLSFEGKITIKSSEPINSSIYKNPIVKNGNSLLKRKYPVESDTNSTSNPSLNKQNDELYSRKDVLTALKKLTNTSTFVKANTVQISPTKTFKSQQETEEELISLSLSPNKESCTKTDLDQINKIKLPSTPVPIPKKRKPNIIHNEAVEAATTESKTIKVVEGVNTNSKDNNNFNLADKQQEKLIPLSLIPNKESSTKTNQDQINKIKLPLILEPISKKSKPNIIHNEAVEAASTESKTIKVVEGVSTSSKNNTNFNLTDKQQEKLIPLLLIPNKESCTKTTLDQINKIKLPLNPVPRPKKRKPNIIHNDAVEAASTESKTIKVVEGVNTNSKDNNNFNLADKQQEKLSPLLLIPNKESCTKTNLDQINKIKLPLNPVPRPKKRKPNIILNDAVEAASTESKTTKVVEGVNTNSKDNNSFNLADKQQEKLSPLSLIPNKESCTKTNLDQINKIKLPLILEPIPKKRKLNIIHNDAVEAASTESKTIKVVEGVNTSSKNNNNFNLADKQQINIKRKIIHRPLIDRDTHSPTTSNQAVSKIINTKVDEVILLDDDEVHGLDKESNGEKSDSRLNIHSFIISNFKELGKIPCVINKLSITFKFPFEEKPIQVLGVEELNTFLTRKIRENVYAIIPSTLNISWTTTIERKTLDTYCEMDIETLNKNMVLTEDGIVDLRDNFETETLIESKPNLMTNLLIFKLGRSILHKDCITNRMRYEILEKAAHFVKTLKEEEKKLMQLKLCYLKRNFKLKKRLKSKTDIVKRQIETIVIDDD